MYNCCNITREKKVVVVVAEGAGVGMAARRGRGKMGMKALLACCDRMNVCMCVYVSY
jgi:hypothetical protein